MIGYDLRKFKINLVYFAEIEGSICAQHGGKQEASPLMPFTHNQSDFNLQMLKKGLMGSQEVNVQPGN